MAYLGVVKQVHRVAVRTGGQPGGFAGGLRGDANAGAAALAGLRDLGFVDAGSGDPLGHADGGPCPQAIPPCIGLMDRLKMDLVPLVSHGCPVKFCSGFVELQDLAFAPGLQGRLIAVGQGLTQAAASLACLGELAERLSLLSRGPDDPLIVHSPRSDVPASAAIKFSDTQEAAFREEYPALRSGAGDGSIPWEEISDRRIRVARLDRNESGLATSLVCLLREGEFYGVPGAPITSTNGAASWSTLQGAHERAVMELIERDAVACWWYNRLITDRVALCEVRGFLPVALADWLAERGRHTHFLRLPTDMPSTVLAAISHDPAGTGLAYGFKAANRPEDAVVGAALEMVQMEMHLQTIADNPPAGDGAAHPLMRMSRSLDAHRHRWLAGESHGQRPWPRAATWQGLLDGLAEKSIPVWSFEATRADLGVPTVKAISPTLRDWYPRFGAGRLFSLPVSLGLRDGALTEAEFNPVRFVC